MDAYIDDEPIEDIEEETDDESSVMTLEDVTFSGRTLQDYENEFTNKLPEIPCSGQEILSAISKIANAYQAAYNCSARLTIVCAKADKDFKVKRNKVISEKITELKTAAGKAIKLPSKDTMEAMAIEGSEELGNLISTLKKWEMVKDYFDSHVKKLHQMLASAKDISYAVHNSERMYTKGNL